MMSSCIVKDFVSWGECVYLAVKGCAMKRHEWECCKVEGCKTCQDSFTKAEHDDKVQDREGVTSGGRGREMSGDVKDLCWLIDSIWTNMSHPHSPSRSLILPRSMLYNIWWVRLGYDALPLVSTFLIHAESWLTDCQYHSQHVKWVGRNCPHSNSIRCVLFFIHVWVSHCGNK